MGLLRIVVKSVDRSLHSGAPLTLSPIDGSSDIGPIVTDEIGCARFKVEQGRYSISAVDLPEGQVLPSYPTVVELYPNTEAAEFVLELTKGSTQTSTVAPNLKLDVDVNVDDNPKLPAF